MSLRSLFQFGKRLLKGKKESATPTTGQQQKQITYQPKPSQAQGQELAVQEIKTPPVVLNQTKALHMGDDIAPAFGSSTYDWAMRIGRGKYTADEWLNHLTSTRKINTRVFGKPTTKIERGEKRFKYDRGPFAGKEINISKEELFDSNLASFNEAGDLTGGLLAAAKKFGIKLDANEVGAMIKLNPINRLKPIELGVQKGAQEAFEVATKNLDEAVSAIARKNPNDTDLLSLTDLVRNNITAARRGELGKGVFSNIRDDLKLIKARQNVINPQERATLNKLEAELNNAVAPMRNNKTRYANETSYTLQGGKDYKETIFHLDEPIRTNSNPFKDPGHFSDTGAKNQIYHVRFDTRFTPDGKKGFLIHEIQSDVNQSTAKNLSKAQQLSEDFRVNPFQKDIELNLLLNQRNQLSQNLNEAVLAGNQNVANAIGTQLAATTRQITKYGRSEGRAYDYFPMVEADQYGDHALKYLMQKAARENMDFVAVAPFEKLSFRQGYKAGNERFYGYASGKGINKSGEAVMPKLMKKNARFYDSKAGPTKISLSDPSLPYKYVQTEKFTYPSKHKLAGKTIRSTYHSTAQKTKDVRFSFIEPSNPNLYFDAFAIKVTPMMRNTQKTYKSKGGLVVDIFKPMRYN